MATARVGQRVTVDDYREMIARGELTENDEVELIRGEIREKMAIGDPHAACLRRLNRLTGRAVGDRAIVSVQDPIRLADSMPEPDLSLLKPRADDYATSTLLPIDILLLVEVADTSLDFDRLLKAPLYAENGIRELWIVNLAAKEVEVYRQPQPNGTYADVRVLTTADLLDMEALPGISFKVADLF